MEFLGTVFQFSALAFGISKAPWLFTKMVSVVKDLFPRDKLSLFQCLDNWLGDAQTKKKLIRCPSCWCKSVLP